MLRLALLLGGAALLAALVWHLGPADVIAELGRIGWYFVAAVLLGGAYSVVRALALHACVARPDVVRYRDALRIRLSGEAIQTLTFTGPVVAEPTKAWLLETRGLTLTEGFAATITEYLIYTFVTAAMSITGLLILISTVDASPAFIRLAITIIVLCGLFLLASAVAIWRRFYLIGTIIAILGRAGLLRGRLRPDLRWINGMEDLLLAVLRDSPLRFAAIAGFEVAAQAVLVFELVVLLGALHEPASISSAFVIESSVKFFEFAFLFVPLQLGVSEAAHAMIFELMGLSRSAGFAVAFLRRARSLAIASAGLALLALMTRHRERRSL